VTARPLPLCTTTATMRTWGRRAALPGPWSERPTPLKPAVIRFENYRVNEWKTGRAGACGSGSGVRGGRDR
jgi:hypothetical protein